MPNRLHFLLALFFVSFVPNVFASDLIWQIGKFDKASREFAQGISPTREGPLDYSNPADDPVFVIGKSQEAKNWLNYQPGTSNARAGHRAHPFTIKFSIPKAPHGVYTFTAALLAYSPRVPILEVQINGHRGDFYQHPVLNYDAGDLGSVFTPRYSTATITFDFPPSYLKVGENQIVLTAVDSPDTPDDSQGAVMVIGNSGIYYDALKLELDPNAHFDPNRIKAQVAATIYYRSVAGRPTETVQADVQLNERSNRGRATLEIANQKLTVPLADQAEFGEQRLEFDVPEFKAGIAAQFKVATNGHSRNFPLTLTPAKKWTVFVIPHEHLDVGFSDFQGKVAEVQSRVIDEAMAITHREPDFRFSIDGFWSAEQYLANRSDAARQEFQNSVREQKIFVPPQYASLLTGLPTAETLIRSLYGGYQINRENGIDVKYANISDVPTCSGSYPSILAAAGLKYFLQASDSYRGPVIMLGRENESSPWYWEGPDGKRILVWTSLSYAQSRLVFGLPPKLPAIHDSLPILLQSYTRPDYKSDGVLLFGTQWENTDLNPDQMGDFERWNKTYTFPKIRISGVTEAMDYISGQMGDSIPVMHGDGGPYWEDGAASDAFYTAMARGNEYRALTAEKLSAITTAASSRLQPEHTALDSMWKNLLLSDEHTWEAAPGITDPQSQQSVRQRDVKEARATEARRLENHIVERTLSALADLIPGGADRVIVFNSLNWQRSGMVETDLASGQELVDAANGKTIPLEVLHEGKSLRRVRFFAENVPSMGYKCYRLQAAKPQSPAPENIPSLENRFYKVEFDSASGAIRSIFDKELNRELVNPSSPYRFGQYLYVTGADQEPNRLIDYSNVTPIPQLEIHPASGGRLKSIERLSFESVAWLESTGLNTPRIETEIVLPDGEKQIQIINHVEKNNVYSKEGVYFAFPFAMDHPKFKYALQNGYIDPASEILKGGSKEWFTTPLWVGLEQNELSAAIVPLDAPLFTIGDIVRGKWPTEFGDRQGTIFSYAMNNYWNVNYVAGQGGDFTFRYVITSASALVPSALTHMAWEALTPFETDEVNYEDKAVARTGPLDAVQSSLLNVDGSDVVVLTWKQAENRDGYILRILETAGKKSSVRISSPLLNIESAWRCNAMEENQEAISIEAKSLAFEIKPYEILTLRVKGKSALKAMQ